GRSSTTTCWPHSSDSFCASTRACRSTPEPAACGTMMRTGRLGKSGAICAAAPEASASIVAPVSAASMLRRSVIVASSPRLPRCVGPPARAGSVSPAGSAAPARPNDALLRPDGELLGEIPVGVGARPPLELAVAVDRAGHALQSRTGAMHGEEQRLVGAAEEDDAVLALRNDDHEAVFLAGRRALERLGGQRFRSEPENRR